MKKTGKITYLFISLVFFVIFDQFVTNLIINNKMLQNNKFIDIFLIQNQGAAFNIFDGYKIFLITFSVVAFVGILFYTIKNIKYMPLIGIFFTSLLSAGIIHNTLERIILGYVRDYIKLNFIDFPIFNISDIFINIGVLGLVFIILKKNWIK